LGGIKVRHLFKILTFWHVGLIEQLQYLIYDSEVYFCVQNFVKPESLFNELKLMKNGGFEISFENSIGFQIERGLLT